MSLMNIIPPCANHQILSNGDSFFVRLDHGCGLRYVIRSGGRAIEKVDERTTQDLDRLLEKPRWACFSKRNAGC